MRLREFARIAALLFGALGCGDCPEVDRGPLANCFGEELGSPACRSVLEASVGPLSTGGISIRCDGLEQSDRGPCRSLSPFIPPLVSESEPGQYTILIGDVLSGPDQFYLTIATGPDDQLLARLCRRFGSDVEDDGGCATCAKSGSVVVAALPDPDRPEHLHAEIHAEFPGGGTLDAVF
jgi:hypothetical protein